MTGFRNILVPVDFSEHSARALEVAIELAKAFDGKVTLLHCYQIQPAAATPYGIVLPEGFDREIREAATRQLEERLEKARAAGVEASASLSAMFPSLAIPETASELGADLIVMGTRGLSGLKHVVLGSVAERTLRAAPCPVLTVKVEDR